jgi:hypothetical protein
MSRPRDILGKFEWVCQEEPRIARPLARCHHADDRSLGGIQNPEVVKCFSPPQADGTSCQAKSAQALVLRSSIFRCWYKPGT